MNPCGCDWRDDYTCSWHRRVQDEVTNVADILTKRLLEATKVTEYSDRVDGGDWTLNDLAILHEIGIDVRSVS